MNVMTENELKITELYKEEITKTFSKTKVKYIKKKYHSPVGRLRACEKDIKKIIFNVFTDHTSLFFDIPESKPMDIGDVREFPKPTFKDINLKEINK